MIKILKLFTYIIIIGGIAKCQHSQEETEILKPFTMSELSVNKSKGMAYINTPYRNTLIYQSMVTSSELNSSTDSLTIKRN